LRERTRLYYVVAWIGRWSMVDIFMESLLGAQVQFGRAVTSAPGIRAVAFGAVVFITILAAEAFDPRLMWDAAARNAHRPLPSGRPLAGGAPAVSWGRRQAWPGFPCSGFLLFSALWQEEEHRQWPRKSCTASASIYRSGLPAQE